MLGRHALLAITIVIAMFHPMHASSPRVLPPVAIIVIESLGFSDVGFHGAPVYTPNLDALARSGVSFSSHYAQPCQGATTVALLTGRYPFRAGLPLGLLPAASSYGERPPRPSRVRRFVDWLPGSVIREN